MYVLYVDQTVIHPSPSRVHAPRHRRREGWN